jgi:rhodanese-related sulfurtransferase
LAGAPPSLELLPMLRKFRKEESQLEIQPGELFDRLQRGEAVRLIDVRTPEERAIVSIKGSMLATRELVQEMLSGWPRDTMIVTYCHSGVRSLSAASFLFERGFSNVRSLSGGIDAWAVEVDPSLARY